MDQLALPYRIGLVAILAVAAVWFVALRPKADAAPVAEAPVAATAPGATGLAADVAKAKDAVAAGQAGAAKTEAAADAADGSAPAAEKTAAAADAKAVAAAEAKAEAALASEAKATAAAKPKAVAAAKAKAKLPTDLSDPILAQVAKGKVAVVLFYDKRSADDRATLRAVKSASAGRRKLAVELVPIARIGRYSAITKGVPVSQSPTLVVIGKNDRATSIVGYADDRAVGQAIDDARKRAAKKTA